MISNNTTYLEFDTDTQNFDFDEDLIDLADSIENIDIIQNKIKSDSVLNLSKFNEYYTNKNETNDEKPYYKFYYNNNIITFKNNDELTKFVTENSYFENQYYIFNIQKMSHNIKITMRNIDSIVNYLLNFHNI